MASLELVVVLLDPRAKLDLFDLDGVLLLPRFPCGTSLLVLELPVVHELDHGWPGIGCNLNQVQPHLFGPFPSLFDADDADLLAILGNQAYGADPDLVVDSDLLFFDGSEPPLRVSFGSRSEAGHPTKEKPGSPGP
jgi:hypothetical protein